MKSGNWFYAEVVNPQVNPNLTKREGWTNISNAVGNTDKWAYSHFTKKTTTTGTGKKKKTTTTYNYPYTVTGHQFGITSNDLPDNAYLKKVTFRVCMKINNDAKVEFPRGLLCVYGNDAWARHIDNTKGKETGWHNGLYLVNPKKKLSKNSATYDYVLSESELIKGKFKPSNFRSTAMGIDLIFDDVADKNSTVYIKYIAVKIDFDVPKYELSVDSSWSPYTSSSNPKQLSSGNVNTVKFNLKQTTKANGGTKKLKITLPWGVEYESSPTQDGWMLPHTIGSPTYEWTVDCNGITNKTLVVKFIDYTVNNQSITLAGDGLSKTIYFKTARGKVDGYNQSKIQYIGEFPPHKRHESCFAVDNHFQSNDNIVGYQIKNTLPFTLVNVKLDEGMSDVGVKVKELIIGSQTIPYEEFNQEYDIGMGVPFTVNFEIPSNLINMETDIGFTVCIRPHNEGANNLQVLSVDSGKSVNYPFNVEPPFTYHIGSKTNDDNTTLNEKFITDNIEFVNHRIASNIETGAFVLPCKVKDGDAVMIQSKPNIHMYQYEQEDYIGCVPLEHLHFEPKSTYKDKLLDNHYKNKRYMGKELASDEDIDLNVRLHPHQVVTMQGLIDMDKPIPINANHRCFESDPLNHRGWAEIYGITVTETNPHWYKCAIDVKYLTHNLNTRFNINRGDKTFGKYTIPSLLAEINSSGDTLSSNSNTDFFNVDTDGSYAYDDNTSEWVEFYDDDGNTVVWLGDDTVLTDTLEDGTQVTYKGEDVIIYLEGIGITVQTPVLNETLKVYEEYTTPNGLKNRFTLDEGQHLSIKSKNPLSTINQVSITWSSSKLNETKENNIRRITRLIDSETDDIVFEYEYCDFDFTGYKIYENIVDNSLTGILTCRVIGRRKNQGDYDTVIDEELTLVTDIETEETTYKDEETNEVFEELEYFGSTLHFQLNNNILKVVDEGYNGKEVSRDSIQLEGKKYYWETYWLNNNTDGENQDIDTYIDIVVQDSVLESNYADKYSSMYISPFPVSDKKIIFTRTAEEGIIYYLEDNKEEFTYLIDPYYQYHNGVDLRESSMGGSIFNLDFGYRTVYLENGLISLGINRLNGKMYLAKYDPVLKEYITLFHLHLNKYDDININSISDDRIELQASDSTIIMYRGHPYVIFKHELEDIGIDTKSYQVWGQSVDGVTSQYPAMFDLMNKDNLLPQCVTGKLSGKCVTVSEHDIDGLSDVTLKLEDVTVELFEEDTVTLNVTGQPSNSRVHFLVKHDDGDNDTGFDEIGHTNSTSFDYKVGRSGAYHMIAVYVGDDEHNYSISNEIAFTVGVQKEVVKPVSTTSGSGGSSAPAPQLSGEYKLTMSSPSNFKYMDNQEIVYTLTRGGQPVPKMTIETVNFKKMHTGVTDSKGQVKRVNNLTNSTPSSYKIGARFWQGGKLIKSVFKDVKVKKADTEIQLNHLAKNRGDTISFKLVQVDNNGKVVRNLANKKVTVTVGSAKYQKTTNKYGNVNLTIKQKGTFKFKVVFNGDTGYKKASYTVRDVVK